MHTWVVGGTNGIGYAIAETLLERTGESPAITGKEVSVTDYVAVRDWVRKREEVHGPIKTLVYSAGTTKLDWLKDIKFDDMNNIFNVNVTGLVRVLKACNELKRVVVIGSDAAWRPMRCSLAYCASKAALEMAVKVVARERASEDFCINLVAPGMTSDTNMTRYIDEVVPELRGWTPAEAQTYERSQIALGRRASPGEVAEVAINVLLMDTPYLNGATIPVNGGR